MRIELGVTRPIVVHVVDATSNVDDFEHKCTRAMTEAIRAANVSVTSSSPHLATTLAGLEDAFAGEEEEWNLLLFVSHGERTSGGDSAYLRLGDHDADWFLANGIDFRIRDKGVLLCVCEGDTEDARWTLVCEQLALWVVAPTAKIGAVAALDFFPAVVQEMNDLERVPSENGKKCTLRVGDMGLQKAQTANSSERLHRRQHPAVTPPSAKHASPSGPTPSAS